MTSPERNAEIWSTRLQREILALESTDDESKKIELLPPFIQTLGHTLNIEGGIAKIEFRVDVEVAEVETGGEDETAEGSVEKATDETATDVKVGEVKAVEEKTDSVAAVDEAKQDESDKTEADKTNEADSAESATNVQDESSDDSSKPTVDPHVILVLDASMYWKSQDSSHDQSKSPQFYPFTKPLAVIKSGSYLFSGGSTIGNGDEVDIDLDWTPR